MTLSHNRAIGTMVLVTLMWSTAGVVTRHLDSARSFEVTFWRSLFTALTLLVLVPLLRGRHVWADMRRSGVAFWASGLCWSVMFTAFMVALTLTSVANVLVTMATGPLLTALVARVFIGHRIPMRTWAAIALAGCGVAIMYGTQVSALHMLGSAVALCVPIAGAVNWTLTQYSHAQGHDVDLVPAVMVGAVLSCIYTLPLAWPFQASSHDLGLLAFLGVTQLAIPCVLSVLCARVLMAPEMSLLALLEVLFGIALAWIGVGEVPRTAVMVGGTLVIGALVANELLAYQQRKKK
jgi:drug/metabolite transporter (DMT)-like permease